MFQIKNCHRRHKGRVKFKSMGTICIKRCAVCQKWFQPFCQRFHLFLHRLRYIRWSKRVRRSSRCRRSCCLCCRIIWILSGFSWIHNLILLCRLTLIKRRHRNFSCPYKIGKYCCNDNNKNRNHTSYKCLTRQHPLHPSNSISAIIAECIIFP